MNKKTIEQLEELKEHLLTYRKNLKETSIGNLKEWYFLTQKFILFFKKEKNSFLTTFFKLEKANELLEELKDIQILLYFISGFPNLWNKVSLSKIIETERLSEKAQNSILNLLTEVEEKLDTIVLKINKILENYEKQELVKFANYFTEIKNCQEANSTFSSYMIKQNKYFIAFFKNRKLKIREKDQALFLTELERRTSFLEKANVNEEEKLACMKRGYRFVEQQIKPFVTIKIEQQIKPFETIKKEQQIKKEMLTDELVINSLKRPVLVSLAIAASLIFYNKIPEFRLEECKPFIEEESEEKKQKTSGTITFATTFNHQPPKINDAFLWDLEEDKKLETDIETKRISEKRNKRINNSYASLEKIEDEKYYYEIPVYDTDFQDFIYEQSFIGGVPYKAVFIAIELESGGSFKSNGIESNGNYGLTQINYCHLKELYNKYGYTKDQIKNDPEINVICCIELFRQIMKSYNYDINNYDMANLLGMYNVGNKSWRNSEQGLYYVEQGLKLFETKYKEDMRLEVRLQIR